METDRQTARVPARLLVAVILSGAYALVAIGSGLVAAAHATYPLAFGLDLGGDRSYPFPWPEDLWVAVPTVLGGLTFLASVVAAGRGHRIGRALTTLWLFLSIATSAVVAFAARTTRRCALVSYSSRYECTSGRTATLRDTVLLAAPAVIALACLLRPDRPGPRTRRRGPGGPLRRSGGERRSPEADQPIS
jgi:hypothetical protein